MASMMTGRRRDDGADRLAEQQAQVVDADRATTDWPWPRSTTSPSVCTGSRLWRLAKWIGKQGDQLERHGLLVQRADERQAEVAAPGSRPSGPRSPRPSPAARRQAPGRRAAARVRDRESPWRCPRPGRGSLRGRSSRPIVPTRRRSGKPMAACENQGTRFQGVAPAIIDRSRSAEIGRQRTTAPPPSSGRLSG